MKEKKFYAIALASLLLILLALPPASRAVTVGLKFFGGYNTMSGGDINEGLKGFFDLYKAEVAFVGGTTSGGYKAFHGGLEVGGDLILYFTPMIGIGFGTSYLAAQSSSEMSYVFAMGAGTIKTKPQVTAVPIRAGLYLTIPISSIVNFSLNAGAEYYLARLKYTQRFDSLTDWEQQDVDTDSSGKIGFCGGFGLEIKIHPNLSILLEGRGRLARADEFEGTQNDRSSSSLPDSWDGTIWYAKVNYGFPIGVVPVIILLETPPPPDPMVQDLRPARLELSGFSALAGIMIRF
jgi:opacity protein-like surface antigen